MKPLEECDAVTLKVFQHLGRLLVEDYMNYHSINADADVSGSFSVGGNNRVDLFTLRIGKDEFHSRDTRTIAQDIHRGVRTAKKVLYRQAKRVIASAECD